MPNSKLLLSASLVLFVSACSDSSTVGSTDGSTDASLLSEAGLLRDSLLCPDNIGPGAPCVPQHEPCTTPCVGGHFNTFYCIADVSPSDASIQYSWRGNASGACFEDGGIRAVSCDFGTGPTLCCPDGTKDGDPCVGVGTCWDRQCRNNDVRFRLTCEGITWHYDPPRQHDPTESTCSDGAAASLEPSDAWQDGWTDAICNLNQHSCPCATGSYCLSRGAACLTPSSTCPALDADPSDARSDREPHADGAPGGATDGAAE